MAAGQSSVQTAHRPASALRVYPVTLLCTLAALILFTIAADFDRRNPGDRYGGKGRYGALTGLKIVAEPELNGLFQLWGERWWDGDWWRLLTTGFHHGDIWHLLFNGAGMIYLGRLLEPRLGSVRFLLVFFAAIIIANVPHVMMNEAAVGLSGGLYAAFGMLLPLRATDDEVAERLPDPIVLLALLWIPIGILLTMNDVMPIGNAAHLTGLIYGWLAGRAVFGSKTRRSRFTPRVFVAAHVLLLPVIVLAAKPVWNGKIHWYRATQTRDLDERIDHLRTAVAWNPRLSGAWRWLADSYRRQGRHDEKWRAIFQAVKASPTNEKSLDLVSWMWRHTSPDDRNLALRTVREMFPERESELRTQFGLFSHPTLPPYRRIRRHGYPTVTVLTPHPFFDDLFWAPVDGERITTPQPLRAPAIDPDRPDSAALGRLL